MLSCNFFNLFGIKKVPVDGGYSGANFADFVKTAYAEDLDVVKRNESYKFSILPKRRIVERSFGWLEKIGACGKIANTNFYFYAIYCSCFIYILLKRY